MQNFMEFLNNPTVQQCLAWVGVGLVLPSYATWRILKTRLFI